MRAMHQHGLTIESVRFDYTNGNVGITEATAAKPVVKESAPKESQTTEKAAKKASRRRKR